MKPSDEPSGSQSIDRATALLALVAERQRIGATLSKLVEESGLKQGTVRRLLVALMRAGLVEQDETTRRYYLGISTYAYGMMAADRYASHSLADESVRRLAELSEDTAFFSVRQGLHTVCLQRAEGMHPIRAHVLNVGQRHPLGVAAHGIAILASLPDPEMNAVIEANQEYYESHYPMLSLPVLRDALAEARRRGCAINRGIFHEGAWAIAIVVRGASGDVVGALSIGAIEVRLRERQAEIISWLRKEAVKLEASFAALGGQLSQHGKDLAPNQKKAHAGRDNSAIRY